MKKLIPWLLAALLGIGWLTEHLQLQARQQAHAPAKAFFRLVSDGENWAVFQQDELLDQLKSSGRPYLPFLRLPTLSTGIYRLQAGSTDQQSPHELDEVYYTLSGRSTFVVEGDTTQVKAGTILYVKAGADHQFTQIEEDLELLVFFSTSKAKE